METLSLIFVIFLPQMCASHSGHAKTKQSDRKRNFLADAMREMESGGKASSHVFSVRKVPNVIRVVMRPEVPPSRRRHHRHRHRQFDGLKSVLRSSEGVKKLSNQHNENHKNKVTQILDAENKLQETVRFLERVNGQLDNISKLHDHKQKPEKVDIRGNITLKSDDEVMVTDSFPLFPELRSIVEHGKAFNPDVTRAAFARAKQIVWDSVGQDPLTSADVGHLNDTKLTNAVALLEMAVREAEKMERNKTKPVDQETNHEVNSPKIPATQPRVNQSKHSDAQLKVLRQLLLEELKQTNLTEDGAGLVLINDIPFQKMRNQKQSRLTQKPFSSPGDSSTDSKVNPRNKNQLSGTQALLEKYTSFITNILKAAHLSVLKNITKDSSSTPVKLTTHVKLASEFQGQQPVINKQNALLSNARLKLNTTKEQQEEHRLSFANAAQEQKQQQRQQQHTQPVNLPKERLDARKAFGTAQKLVKAMLARQELYKAEADFFDKIHEMLNKSSKYPLNSGPENDARESRITGRPTVASPIKSPISQSPINTATSPSLGGEDNKRQPSESQKKFDEAAHLEEKVAAQQDLMYDALMKGHTIGTVKGGGGGTFEEEGAIRENEGQEGLDNSYNTEDYGDFKDSDEEAEKKFYHDHNQDNFEGKEMEDTTLGLRDKIIQLIPEHASMKESSSIDMASTQTGNVLYKNDLNCTFGESGDSSGDHNARENGKTRRSKQIYRKRKLLGKL